MKTADSKGLELKIRLSNALLVPDTSGKWAHFGSPERPIRVFYKSLEVRTRSGIIFAFEEHESFPSKTVNTTTGAENFKLSSEGAS